MEPSLGVYRRLGGLGILVVAQQDVGTLGEDLARHVGRVAAVDAHLLVVGGLSARSLGEGLPVAVADDGATLRGTVAHGIGEANLAQKGLHLAVERSTADDDLVEVAAEGLAHLGEDGGAHLLADDGHGHEQSHLVGLQLGEHLLADDLLDDQRHGDHDARLDVGQRLGDDGGRGHAVEIVDVHALEKLEDKLKRHAVHVGHGQDADDVVAALKRLAQHVEGEVDVAPQRPVGQHHALGAPGGAAGVVDEGQLLGALLAVVVDVLLAEVFRILLAKHLVEVFAGVGELLGAADHERIVGDVDDALQSRHLRGVDLRGRHVADEEELGVAVVDDVVDLVGRELVEDGHGHRAIGEDGEEGGSPGRGVASAEGYLVAPLHARGLKHDVQFLYLARHIVILQRLAFVVGKRVEIPVVDDTLLDEGVKTRNLFHLSLLVIVMQSYLLW